MAINFEDWKNIDPRKHNIKLVSGHTVEVLSKVKGRAHPTYLVRCPNCQPEELAFITDGRQEIGIVNSDMKKEEIMNHPANKIIPKKTKKARQ